MENGAFLPLPHAYVPTREALRTVACYLLGPARKAVDGHIGLQATPGGFGTPALGRERRQLRVAGGSLVQSEGHTERQHPIATLEEMAHFAGVELSSDPGVGDDLPPFEPTTRLPVEDVAAEIVAAWFELGDRVMAELRGQGSGAWSEATLWPEHFDLAAVHRAGADDDLSLIANVGFAPGDAVTEGPYVYVGPWLTDGLRGPFWNQPFGAQLDYRDVMSAWDPAEAALDFVLSGLDLVSSSRA